MSQTAPLLITAGEPAGIGPDLCLAVAAKEDLPDFVIVGDAELLRERATRLGVDIAITSTSINDYATKHSGNCVPQSISRELLVVDLPFPAAVECGKPNPENAGTLLDGLRTAVRGCEQGMFSAMVTAPLAKSVVNDAGIPFSGHTEFLAELTDVALPVMLLVAGELRVALASTHMPLRDVPDYLNRDRLTNVLEILIADLRNRFGIDKPQVIVCGLNPHAGEGGHLGSEDDELIAPVVAAFRKRGDNVRGPTPADTAFTPAAGHSDAVLAMYHDQGLPVLKYAGFGRAVNVTLGLPIIRTSVDHGTAFDLAGSGQADSGSMIAAIKLAGLLAQTV